MTTGQIALEDAVSLASGARYKHATGRLCGSHPGIDQGGADRLPRVEFEAASESRDVAAAKSLGQVALFREDT